MATERAEEAESGLQPSGTGKEKLRWDLADSLIRFLNDRAKTNFLPAHAVLHQVAIRLLETGNDVGGVRKMIDRQVALWSNNPRMKNFLRPATLFGEKFSDYYGQREQPVMRDSESRRGELVRLIEQSPANRKSIYHRPDASADDKARLQAWRAELATLDERQPKEAA